VTTPEEKPLTPSERIKRLGLLFEHAEQKLLVGLVLISLIGIGVWSWRHSARVNTIIDIDHRAQRAAAFQIDLNVATWQDISNLPGIGDRLAHDIVAYRDQFGSFQNNDAIQSVSGIGPHKYQAIAPFLLPISSEPASMAAAATDASKR